MRWLSALLFFFLLVACTKPASLYTDETFRAASPEIINAWKTLPPLQDARVRNLPLGGGFDQLKKALTEDKITTAVIGVALTSAQQTSLRKEFPDNAFLFLSADDNPSENTLGVRRAEAWALVGGKAASSSPATVYFPHDATASEIEEFQAAWSAGGGGSLTTSTAYDANLLAGATQVFQWGGPEWDTLVQSLKGSVAVHGNPGLLRQTGASGLTWRIRESGLGAFLWKTALEPGKNRHFLPLETVLEHR